MTEFQKQVYADMKSTDRILLWMAKCQELMEFSSIMTKEDIEGVRKVCDLMEGGQHEEG